MQHKFTNIISDEQEKGEKNFI